MEEEESLEYTSAQEAIGLAMSVMEVVARLGKLVGNMLGLLVEEMDIGQGLIIRVMFQRVWILFGLIERFKSV